MVFSWGWVFWTWPPSWPYAPGPAWLASITLRDLQSEGNGVTTAVNLMHILNWIWSYLPIIQGAAPKSIKFKLRFSVPLTYRWLSCLVLSGTTHTYILRNLPSWSITHWNCFPQKDSLNQRDSPTPGCPQSTAFIYILFSTGCPQPLISVGNRAASE